MITPILLCGGMGKRLWPLSTPNKPKQFLDIVGHGTSNLEDVLQKIIAHKIFHPPIIVCNYLHLFFINNLLAKYNIAKILVEPLSCNTAPAISSAIHYLSLKQKNNTPIMIFPSDIYIKSLDEILEKIAVIEPINDIICFGVRPISPDTSFGYIEKESHVRGALFKAKGFYEKPREDIAKDFLKQGNHLWNTGIFITSLKELQHAFQLYAHEVWHITAQALKMAYSKESYIFLPKAVLKNCPIIAIDKAIMEKIQNIMVIELSCPWADLGNWPSVIERTPHPSPNVIMQDCHNCYTYIPTNKAIIMGLKDVAIIQTLDTLVVMPKHSITQLANQMPTAQSRYISTDWGEIRALVQYGSYIIEFIQILSGHTVSIDRLSQTILVVKGTASIIKATKTQILHEGKSYNLRQKDKISNLTLLPLHVMLITSDIPLCPKQYA